MLIVQPCDIFFSRGNKLISKAIRFFERSEKDPHIYVDHTGLFVESEIPINKAVCIEARVKVYRHNFWKHYYTKKDKVAIYRPLNLTLHEKEIILLKAQSYVGLSYGYIKIAAHFLDYFFGGKNIFRRFLSSDEHPICSWVVAQSFYAIGKTFGIEGTIANPENIWDFVKNNPDKYQCIHNLEYLKEY